MMRQTRNCWQCGEGCVARHGSEAPQTAAAQVLREVAALLRER